MAATDHDGGAETVRVFAGECHVRADEDHHRGKVVVLIKPDNTVLVHDVSGYQPVAWITRAESVSQSTTDGFALTAIAGETVLEVESCMEYGTGSFPVSRAGVPVAACPDCAGVLVRAGDLVTCLGCDRTHGLPDGSAILDDTCSCGLPRMRVDRGAAFELCIDRRCESLTAAVRDRFDGEWPCPACEAPLRIIRRGGLLAGCDRYPDCDRGFMIPTGTVADRCPCGLPLFDTPRGTRCLDATCDRATAGD